MCTHSSTLGGPAGLFLAITMFGLSSAPSWSQVPQRIVHQGVLQDTDGIALPDGPHAITFTLHDAAESGATLWTEEHPAVETTDGLFHVILGSIVPLDVAFDAPLWLGMSVDGSAPLAPRLELTSSPYSLTARSVLGETNVFPSDGDVGIGTGGVAGKSQQTAGIAATPQAKLDVEGDLRIGVVTEATDATKVLVQEDADQIVRYVPIEDLTGGGFSLPFAGTVNVPQPAFAATNEGGAGIQGTSDDFTAVEGRSLGGTGVFGRSTDGDGVVGESDDGAGVSGVSDTDRGVMGTSTTGPGVNGESGLVGVLGTSTGGIGVEGGSPDATGVKAVSTTGIGIEASGLPAGQFNGTVRIVSADPAPTDLLFGRVGPPVGGQKSRLFIEEVEEDPNEERFLVWSADQFVRYRTPEEFGSGIFDGILDNTALIVNDAGGAEVVRADPETGLSLNCDGKANCAASFNAQLHVVDDNGNSILNADPETGLEFDCQGKPDCEASFVTPARFGLCVSGASCTTLTGDGLTLENGAALTFSDGTTQTSGFSLPFAGTANVGGAAFLVENQGGDGLVGISLALGGEGVSGEADDGDGVRGDTDSGTGVRGVAHDLGTGVRASSVSGAGLVADGNPAAEIKGTVEIVTDQLNARQSRLKIEQLDEDPNEEKILVWSADQFVRYKTLDESGFDGVLNNTALVITDGTGAETTRINPDGTSIHEGLETFRGGIALDGVGVGITFNDGTTQTTGFSLPFSATINEAATAFDVENAGGGGISGRSTNEFGTGVLGVAHSTSATGVVGISELGIGVSGISRTGVGVTGEGDPAGYFAGTVEIRSSTPDNGPPISRPSRLFIEQLQEDPNEPKILVWSADKFVKYKTLDESGFDGVLSNTDLIITDNLGNETTRINADGTSFHKGLETFSGGIAVDNAESITFRDDLGSPTAQFNATDGSGYLTCTDADANGALDADECKAACDGDGCRFNDDTRFGDCTEDDACADLDAVDGFRFDLGAQTVFGDVGSRFTINYRDVFAVEVGGLTNTFSTMPIPGLATANFYAGDCNGDGIGSSNLCLRVIPGLGTMEVQDQAGVTFMSANASLQLLSVLNLAVDDLTVNGTLSKPAGSFKIDHPLDPENKYLYHSFVESPDMMNVYNGNVVLDATGAAVVKMPDWFETLNRDFRYQLTPIGGPGPGLYIAEEIEDGQFAIAGGAPGLKVSWLVTGIRHDPYAEQHRIPVEVEKTPQEQGTYLHPEVYGQPASRSLSQVRSNGAGR